MPHRRWRWLTPPVVVVATGMLSATTAWATSHTVDAEVYRTATYECTHAHGYINNTSARPHIDSYAQADEAFGTTPCSTSKDLAAYQIAVREDLYVWTGSQWAACNYGPWLENNHVTYIVSTSWNPVYPCGIGAYFMAVGAYIYNNGWQGGWAQTTYVWV